MASGVSTDLTSYRLTADCTAIVLPRHKFWRKPVALIHIPRGTHPLAREYGPGRFSFQWRKAKVSHPILVKVPTVFKTVTTLVI